MGDLPLKETAEWAVLGLVGWFFALRLLERGVRTIDMPLERRWTGMEGSLGGRKLARPSLGAPLRWAGRKLWAWIATGALIVADPFLEIAKSFLPERDQEEQEQASEDTAAAGPKVEKEGMVANEPPQVAVA